MRPSRSTHINWIHLYNGSIIFHSMHESYISDSPINKFTKSFGLSPTKDVILNRLEHRSLHTLLLLQHKYWKLKGPLFKYIEDYQLLPQRSCSPTEQENRDVFGALSCSIYTFCLSHTKAPVGNTKTNKTNFFLKPELSLIVTIFHGEQRLESDSSVMACTEEIFPFLHLLTPSISLLSFVSLSSFKRWQSTNLYDLSRFYWSLMQVL